MTGFRRYPDYRDPGVEWLAEIPAHWEMVELRRVAPARPADAVTRRHNRSVWQLDLEHIAADTGRVRAKHSAPMAEIGGSTVWFDESHVLYSKLRPYLNKVVLPDESGIATSELIPLSPNPDAVNRSFLAYHLLSPGFVAYASRHVSGTKMPRVIPTFFWSHTVPLPPLPEQRAIANFLDRRTSRIDRLVQKKERLIELLSEKRASLISHAVTRGLDPDVPMMDPGVEWGGEIPAHWGMVELKRLAPAQPADALTGRHNGSIWQLDLEHIAADTGRVRTKHRAPVSEIGGSTVWFDESKVLYSKLRPYLNKVVVPDESGIATSELIPLSPNPDAVNRLFLAYYLLSPGFVAYASRHVSGTKMPRVIPTFFWNHTVPLPPLAEQRAIADFLDRKTGQIEALVAKTRNAIDRLREYRSSVISAAVTGQIDVRDPSPTAVTLPRHSGWPEATSARIMPDM